MVTIFLATAFGPLQRVLDTVELSPELWAVCIVVAASIIVVEEVRKVIRRRARSTEAATIGQMPVPTPAS